MAEASSSIISTETLLEGLILETFGTLTIVSSKWPADRTDMPRRSYFADRRKYNTNAPINRKCASHILTLYKIALTEKTGYDRFAISEKLAKILSIVAGTSMHVHELVIGDSRETQIEKTTRQIQALETLLTLAQDQQFVRREDYRKALASQPSIESATQAAMLNLRNNAANAPNTDIAFMADSVAEAGYSNLILQTRSTLDISHFHGAKWTKANYPALSERFSYGNLTVRVVLASYESPFFGPYAMLKNTAVPEDDRIEDMKGKIKQAINTWTQLYEEAATNGAQNLRLEIYLHKQTPSMAIYRFDQTMVITPTKNSANISLFPAFKLYDTVDKNCAFKAFLEEFESLASLANLHAMLDQNAEITGTKRSSAEFLRKLLGRTFGVTTINYSSWSFGGIEQRPKKMVFTERLNQEPLAPLDERTAGYLIQTMDMALDGRAPIGATIIAKKITGFFFEEYGIDIRQYEFRTSDSPIHRTVKRQGILNVLGYFVSVAVNRREFDLEDVKTMLKMGHF